MILTNQFCIKNDEDRCIQCRDFVPRARECPAYRIQREQLRRRRREAIEKARDDFRKFSSEVKN